jgi:hypothetical protein
MDNDNEPTELMQVASAVSKGPIHLSAAALNTYMVLLRHPMDAWRANNQLVYVQLRDALAAASGRSPEDIQRICSPSN